jgi:hypothetical protein
MLIEKKTDKWPIISCHRTFSRDVVSVAVTKNVDHGLQHNPNVSA